MSINKQEIINKDNSISKSILNNGNNINNLGNLNYNYIDDKIDNSYEVNFDIINQDNYIQNLPITGEESNLINEKIQNLIEENKILLEKNTKLYTKMISLEQSNKKLQEKIYIPFSDTNNNFFLPSEIKELWEKLAIQNIGDCFIDYFNYPTITYHLVQEMFYIMIQMVKEKINTIIDHIIKCFGFDFIDNDTNLNDINTNTNTNINTNYNYNTENQRKIKEDLIYILNPFFMNYVKEIFFSNDNKSNKVFNDNYMNNFILFYNQEILPLLNQYTNNDVSNYNIYDIVNSSSFLDTMSVMKKIVLFIELNSRNKNNTIDNKLTFNINDFLTREITYDKKNNKEKDYLSVNGKVSEDQQKLILLTPPKNKFGKNYQNLKQIILPIDRFENINHKSNSTKDLFVSPIRCSSYKNIYHYTEKEEEDFEIENNNNNNNFNSGNNSNNKSKNSNNSNNINNINNINNKFLNTCKHIKNQTIKYFNINKNKKNNKSNSNNNSNINKSNLHNNSNNNYSNNIQHNNKFKSLLRENSFTPTHNKKFNRNKTERKSINNNNNKTNKSGTSSNNTNTNLNNNNNTNANKIIFLNTTKNTHTRSLSKNTNTSDKIPSNNIISFTNNFNNTCKVHSNNQYFNSNNRPFNSNEKNKTQNNSQNKNNKYNQGKIYKLKKKGKNIVMEEMKPENINHFNFFKNNNKAIKTYGQNDEIKTNNNCKNNNINSINNINNINIINNLNNNKLYIKTENQKQLKNNNINHHNNSNIGNINYANNDKIKKINDINIIINNNNSSNGNKNNLLLKKNKQLYNKKVINIEKNFINYKTNAVTKVNVDDLLSLKNKKQFLNFRKTFVQNNGNNIDNI